MEGVRSYAHGLAQNLYHLEWVTKYRDDRFRNSYRRKVCEGALRIAALRWGIRIHALRVLPDHVHIFVELKPSMSPSKAVNLLKGISSRIIRRRFKHLAQEKALWSPGKFIRSVGSVTADTIDYYITRASQNQYDQQTELGQWTKTGIPAL